MMKTILKSTVLCSLLYVLCSTAICWSATYYVDATNGNDSNPGTSKTTPWKTISKVNRSQFQPGDFILFKCGETWREQLTVPSSGRDGNHITFSAYGTGAKPIISGANEFTSWKAQGAGVAGVYKTTGMIAKPYQVFEDGARLTSIAWVTDLTSTYASMKAGSWTCKEPFDWNSLYVWSTHSTAPSNHTIEASQRDYCIYADNKNYITVQNIHFSKPKWSGIFAKNGSKNWTIQNVISEYSYTHGIQFGSGNSENINIESSELCYNGGSGYNGNASHVKIQRNEIHDNCLLGEPGYRGHEWEGGIYVGTLNTEDILVEHNHFYNNGRATNPYISGPAIWFDGCNHTWGDTSFNSHITPSIIRYNFIEGNRSGIKVECNSYTEVYYNIVIDSIGDDTAIQHGQGIMVARYGHDVKIYNNVSYHNRINFGVVGTWPKELANMTNIFFKNNISDNALERELIAVNGGQNDGVYGYGNIYENNCFGIEYADFIEWGGKAYKSTYAAWEVAYGGKTHSVEVAPLFQDSQNNNFRLMPSSPCINAGTNVGSTFDYGSVSVPQGERVDVGAFEYKIINPPDGLRLK